MAWVLGDAGLSMGNTLLPPNPQYPNCLGPTSVPFPGMYGMSSRHPGGANILMGDGSVRVLKYSVSNQVVWALGSIAQGEVIDASSY